MNNEQVLVQLQKLQRQMMHRVRFGDIDAVEALLDEWFVILRICSPEVGRSLILQFVCHLSVELWEEDTSLTELLGKETFAVEDVLQLDTSEDVQHVLKEILQRVCAYTGEKKRNKSLLLAKQAARYIDEHYADKIKVDDIANAVYLSSGYLMTVFKKEMGMSVISYLRMRRMEKAKELLLDKKLKIYEVAERVGYDSTNFFSATFRDYVGMSPKQFKEENLKG